MNNPRRFTSLQTIEEESSLWLSKIDRGLSEEDRQQIGEWLAAEPRHRETLLRLAGLWDQLDVLGELSGLIPLPAPSERALARRRLAWMGGLAVAGVAALAVAVLLRVPSEPRDNAQASAVATASPPESLLTTAVGEQRSVTLEDGSVVQLNTSTTLRVAFASKERSLELQRGEAQFDVQPDSNRPFVVRAGDHAVRAVGTAFNVRVGSSPADARRFEVIVTEGRVRVTTRNNSSKTQSLAEVSAGEVLSLRNAQPAVAAVSVDDLADRLAWQRGMMIFEGEPLESALAEVERYTNVRFRIEGVGLRRMRIGGFYKVGDVEGLVRSLEQNLGVRADRRGELIELSMADP